MDNIVTVLLVLAKTMGLMIGVLLVLGAGFIVTIDIWGKRSTEARLLGVFLDHRKLYSKLLLVDVERAYLGRGDKREEYYLDKDKQYWAGWPAGLPSVLQIPVRAHLYIRNQSEPLDPENPEATLSARSRMMISDEAMLKTTWRDVREAAGGAAPATRSSSMAIILLAGNLALTGFILYLVLNVQTLLGG